METAILARFAVNFAPGFPIPNLPEFIQAFESCRLTAYQDQRGIWTIGWGHTGPEVVQGLVWSQAQADAQLVSDLAVRTAAIAALCSRALTPGQMLACCSLIYNSGLEAFRTSHLLVLINQNSLLACAPEFLRWDHVGPGESRGLLHRRLAEALCFIRDSA